MKKSTNIYVNNNYGYNIESNRNNIEKDEIIDNFIKAYHYNGCQNILRKRDEYGIKYTMKFETFNDYNVIIPTSFAKQNKQMIKKLNTVCKMMKLKKKKIKEVKMKKIFMGTCIVLAGAFVAEKAVPIVNYGVEKAIENDNEKFNRELEESGAIEMQQNLETQKNHEEALEAYYNDQKLEEQQTEKQVDEFKEQIENIEEQYTQQMINDMEQYRDLDTMPFVNQVEESEQKLR